MARSDLPSVLRLILVPAVITLAVTLLRLAGERMGASSALFSRAAGGGGALVGIVWLVPVFGFWFGWRLARAGQGPGSAGRVALYGLAAAVACIGLTFAGVTLGGTNRAVVVGGFVAGVVAAVAIAQRAWPELFRTLFAYALAARIPVALIMLAAIYGNWGTHYDVAPPDFPEMGTLAKWFAIGVVPQLSIWIWYTVVVGMIFGIVAAAVAGRRPATA